MKPSQRRLLSQLIFFALSMGILALVIITGNKAIHNACPFALICFGFLRGSLYNFTVLASVSGIVLGTVFKILALFRGRVFCGFICPLGTMQEALFALRGKKRRKRVSFFYERRFARLKYLVLALCIALVSSGLAWLYINFCPIFALSRIPALAWGGLIVLTLILLSGIYLERFWCRYLCPYAALLNMAQALGKLFGIKRTKVLRNLERCIDCGICSVNCPMNIDLLASEYVESCECIHCLRCATKCPKKGTISCEKEN
jgi:polyferredoxin